MVQKKGLRNDRSSFCLADYRGGGDSGVSMRRDAGVETVCGLIERPWSRLARTGGGRMRLIGLIFMFAVGFGIGGYFPMHWERWTYDGPVYVTQVTDCPLGMRFSHSEQTLINGGINAGGGSSFIRYICVRTGK